VSNYISGMASGFDWASMITQLIALERRPIDLMESDKENVNARYNAWTSINTNLLSLKTAAKALSTKEDFNLYSSSSSITGTSADVTDLLDFSVGSNATEGSYSLKVNNLAQAQKLGSRSFSSTSEALNISGDLVINGRTVNIASTDSLSDIRNKINELNSGENSAGVTASVFTVGQGEYRLTFTSQKTGAGGIDIANGSSTDVLGLLGLTDGTADLKHAVTEGAQSSLFTSSTQDIETLLGLSAGASGNVTIAGESIAIDLSTDSLQSIRDTINSNANLQSLGVSASIVSETNSGTTQYRIQINGTQSLTDTDNILQTLGFLKLGHSDVTGLAGSTGNTVNGKTITEDTLLIDIDGYNTWTSGDTITIQGTDHGGSAVGPVSFTVNASSTVGDLLQAVETAFGGNISAYVDGNGAIVVEDQLSGASGLTLTLTSNLADANSVLDFGAFDASTIRKRQITAGEDALITVDGIDITRSDNQITDVISGVTLSLRSEDPDAEITLNINRDYDGIKKKISDFVTSYNDIISYVNSQFDYTEKGEDVETPALFGDSGLLTVRGSIRNVILSGVTGLSSSFDHLSLIGVNLDKNGNLSINDAKLDGYLRTNFSDVVNLFVAQGSSSNSNVTYLSSREKTQEGTYELEITQAAAQAYTTGVGFNGILSEDSTLTVTDQGGREAIISLEAGWGITSIVNAMNSEFSREYQEIRVGANSYYSDASQASAVNAGTTWDSVYDGAGASANLADGDEIIFSGTNRSGKEISGSYIISDVSSDTIGGLLSEIEASFGSGYDAYIDPQGRIAIKDTAMGDSRLSLSISAVKNLDFGAIDVDPTGADGSQEGRYSMNMTAAESDGQLKISNNDYGENSFTVSAAGGNLGITDGTYTGTAVAGRIRAEGSSTWMTMTGSGRTLTVDNGQDAEGLVLRYAGSSTGTFDFTFVTGVGEKMDRALYYMTDTFDGFIADKQSTLKNRMNSIDLKIEATERRIAKREEILMAQFVTMERLITQFQAQQQWLGSQIGSLGGWWGE
jgi:flagellar hook-associated protein 2